MNQTARKFEVIEGGSLGGDILLPNEPTNEPLTNQNSWLDTGTLADLANVSERATQKALKARKWRGADLVVRELASNVGRGGKILQVHVDSLPADLRERWYLARGIELHQKSHPETGETLLVPQEAFERDARHEKAFAVAKWRHEIIKPALALPPQSAGRSKMLDELAQIERTWPGGQKKESFAPDAL